MKPSDLPKNDNFSGIRMNKEIKAALKKLGMSPQKIVDAYINEIFTLDVNVLLKHRPKPKGKK
jgi:hypothetical protein